MFARKAMPPLANRRFYPTKKDIRNHIYRATIKQRFSNCDQTNVSKMVDKWVQHNPDDKLYFRPYADVDKTCEIDGSTMENVNDDKDNEEDEDGRLSLPPLGKSFSLSTRQHGKGIFC